LGHNQPACYKGEMLDNLIPICAANADEVTRAAERLARLYSRGFDLGLRGCAAPTPLEGTQAMADTLRRGHAAGLRRRAALAAG
jgi:hypothetical protein